MSSPSDQAPEDDGWSDERVARWLRQSEGIERQLTPVSDVLFAAAALRRGEHVLDVGCGTGPTTRQAAAEVGIHARVAGLDIAAEMLRAAAAVPADPSAAPIDWIEADVVTWEPTPAQYDVVVSRFGVMFFSDPATAFGALAAAARPGGRLAVATWARRDESELFEVPLRAALDTLDRDAEAIPKDLGPFSLNDPAGLAALLGGAGWVESHSEVHRLALRFGGGIDPATAAVAALDFGPTRLVTADLDDDARSRAIAAIEAAFADHLDDDGHVVLGGTVLITTATRAPSLNR